MQLDFDLTLAIVRNCVNAGRADLIEDALFERLSVSDLRAKIEAERPAPPAQAAQPSAASAATPIFPGGPTPKQADALQAVLKKRFEAMYPKAGG